MRVTLAQLNPTVGDLEGNLRKAQDALAVAAKDSSDLVVFPELYLSGYPPRDLLQKGGFIRKTSRALARLVKATKKHPRTGALLGAPIPDGAGRLFNSAILICAGKILLTQHKSLLPTYDVFDEARYFTAATKLTTVAFKGETLGVTICEDAWNDPCMWGSRKYGIDPVAALAKEGATLMINIAASPFHAGKDELRHTIIRNHARRHRIPFVFVNQVGANDELVFDGASMCFDAQGRPSAVLPSFKEHLQTVDTCQRGEPGLFKPQDPLDAVHDALVLGIRDYMRKCGFEKAVLGLSGGIDSAVTCCLAAEAVGAGNVLGVSMPGPYSSQGSLDDARRLAENLGIGHMTIPITGIYDSYLKSLKDAFRAVPEDATEENIQARIRGNLLMALSNKFGHLLLSTGNKSELAVGYCTLYGDMSGGLAAISDVPKTMIYGLAADINRAGEIIPSSSINKAPSAELRPNQADQDTLPPYEILDRILHHYIDVGLTKEEIVRKRLDKKTVEWVVDAVNRSEYKRRQAAPGLKVTTKAFGTGRRMPIAAKHE